MSEGKVVAVFISPSAGEPMERLQEVEVVAGAGLKGDRYTQGAGSWNKEKRGRRQVTLINSVFFKGSGFGYEDSRRNIVTEGVELMALIGKEFKVGDVMMCGVKYCDPCDRPSKLSKKEGFKKAFHDRGGLIAEVLTGGVIRVNDRVAVIQPSNPAQK